MKIIVLHGEDNLKSYERLQKFIEVAKKRGFEIYRISEKGKTISEILSVSSLFARERFFILEDTSLFTKKDSDWLLKKRKDLEGTLIIYHDSILSKTFLNSIPKPDKIEEYKLPKLVWSFLESFWPGNAKNVIQILHKVVQNEPIELVFSLLSRHLRDLYWVKVDHKGIPYPSWRVGKLFHQTSKFTAQDLFDIISLLAEADVRSKTSQEKLIDLLDFIIISHLE